MKQVKEGYKITELGEIPQEWRVKALKDISKIISGGTPSTNDDDYWNPGDIYWATPTDITSNGKYINKTRQRITLEGLKNSSANMLPVGSILMTSRATIGETCINLVPICTNQGFKSFICNDGLHNEFLYYLLGITKNNFINLSAGSTFLEISKSAVERYKIPLPPLNEQKKIASILSSVDEQIELTYRLIKKTKELKKGLMQQLLTQGIGHDKFKDTEIGRIPEAWKFRQLSSVAYKVIGGGTPSRKILSYYEGEIPWVTVKDLDKSFYKSDAIEYINLDAVKNSATNIIEPENIIVATRMGLGRGFINKVPMAINQDLKAIILKTIIIPEFFMFWYLSKSEIIESMGKGSTVKGIRLEELNMLILPIPPLKEQKEIVSILLSIDNQINEYEINKERLKELKKGLMQQLLTGKIRVKVDSE